MARIKIGEKEYEESELEAALEARTRLQEMAPVLQMAERYRLTPEELASNAEGAFGQIIQLQELGVLDDEGRLVKKQEQAPSPPNNERREIPPQQRQDMDTNSLESIVMKALGPVTEKFTVLEQELRSMKDNQGRIMREKIMEKVQRKHPELSEEDVSFLVAKASATKEDFWKLAEDKVKGMEESKQKTVENFASEYGLDLAQLNKLKEMKSKEGGVADMILEGKRVSSKGGENTVTPKEAMLTYLQTADELEKE